jgi:hypothetical protein
MPFQTIETEVLAEVHGGQGLGQFLGMLQQGLGMATQFFGGLEQLIGGITSLFGSFQGQGQGQGQGDSMMMAQGPQGMQGAPQGGPDTSGAGDQAG